MTNREVLVKVSLIFQLTVAIIFTILTIGAYLKGDNWFLLLPPIVCSGSILTITGVIHIRDRSFKEYTLRKGNPTRCNKLTNEER